MAIYYYAGNRDSGDKTSTIITTAQGQQVTLLVGQSANFTDLELAELQTRFIMLPGSASSSGAITLPDNIRSVWRPSASNYENWEVAPGWEAPVFTRFTDGFIKISLPHIRLKTGQPDLSSAVGIQSHLLIKEIPNEYLSDNVLGASEICFLGYPNSSPGRLYPCEFYIGGFGATEGAIMELWIDFDPLGQTLPTTDNPQVTFGSMTYLSNDIPGS